jgi:Putative phage tail protein
MATLVLSAVGTFIGGPIGGSIGALIGSQIDQTIFKPSAREGPRLKELAVTTASYGVPLARHFGKMRVAGSIIWSTELVESSEKVGGGKGQPSTKAYSYSISFAVALASRPIASVGRIWADGNLLRGAAGDLKVAGQFRFYSGHGDQQPDPLLSSAEGPSCPAFRGLAYCVFESLQLAEFGNRVPALTFEVICEDGDVRMQDLLSAIDTPVFIDRSLPGLIGFSDEGGPLKASLEAISQVYPIACDVGGSNLSFANAEVSAAPIGMLPEAVVAADGESFGGQAGRLNRHSTAGRQVAAGIRYYDAGRDYQAGLQRTGGRPAGGRDIVIEFPGCLMASDARALAEQTAERQGWAQDRLNWRIAEVDPSLRPGSIVLLPDHAGRWRVESWEWREYGLELELLRLPNATRAGSPGDPGRSLPTIDLPPTPTSLYAFELPWDGQGAADARQVFAAASSVSAGWTGAMLYVDSEGGLLPVVGSGHRRSILGNTLGGLASGQPHLVDRVSTLDVQLVASDMALAGRPLEDLAQGANRALVGTEVIQFAAAESLGEGRWRLGGILRGRGGTEGSAQTAHPAGAPFVLLDGTPVRLEPLLLGNAASLAAIGLADPAPVFAPIAGTGTSLKPLTPVHPHAELAADGSLALGWTRRARGAWNWNSTVEPPLVEQVEQYEVGLGNPDQPGAAWIVTTPQLVIASATRIELQSLYPGATLWVRQIGSFARSEPLLLTSIS